MTDEEEESGYRTVSSVDGLTSISDVIPRGQEDLTNNGQSLASWAVDASATSTYLPGQKTTVADLVKAAAAAGEGAASVRAEIFAKGAGENVYCSDEQYARTAEHGKVKL